MSWLHISAQQFIILEHRIQSQSVLREYMALHPCFAPRRGATRGQGPGLTRVSEQTPSCRGTEQGLSSFNILYLMNYTVNTCSTKYYICFLSWKLKVLNQVTCKVFSNSLCVTTWQGLSNFQISIHLYFRWVRRLGWHSMLPNGFTRNPTTHSKASIKHTLLNITVNSANTHDFFFF